jgi:hypothetical protein
MNRKALDTARPRRSAQRAAIVFFLFGGFTIAQRNFVIAQQSERGVHPPRGAGTILNAEFASKLADPELDWPTVDSTAAADLKDTRAARSDACMWQEIVLAKRFAVGSWMRGDKGEPFTAGVSTGGYDGVYYRWETERYWMQFRCAQGLMSVMLERKTAPERRELLAPEIKERTAAILAEVVRRGPQLLANCSMKLEPTEYGYLIRFQQTDEQFRALRREKTDRFLAPDSDPGSDTGNDWLTHMKVRTDGYSFVFDFPKMGTGATWPSHMSTTQPGEKTWFKERKPAEAPTP